MLKGAQVYWPLLDGKICLLKNEGVSLFQDCRVTSTWFFTTYKEQPLANGHLYSTNIERKTVGHFLPLNITFDLHGCHDKPLLLQLSKSICKAVSVSVKLYLSVKLSAKSPILSAYTTAAIKK